jgi:hypothetical protein
MPFVQLPYLIVGHAKQFLEHSFIVLAKPGSAQFGAIGPGRDFTGRIAHELALATARTGFPSGANGKCLRHTWGTNSGKITLSALPFKRRDAEAIAANMSKAPDVERGCLAAYGRIIVAFMGGLQIDLETP